MDKETFKIEAKEKIEDISSEFEQLEKKSEKLSSEIKKDFKQKLDSLKEQKKKLESKFEEVKASSQLNWEIVQETFENTENSIKSGINELTESVN
ncbi:MAG: hypothetical protein WDZ35_11465 [Crocinitomicaceae bacterium]